MRALVLVVALGCGDQVIPPAPEAGLDLDAQPDSVGGGLFGEPCTQPTAPEVGICHDGEGACHDEPGGSVCRPFCHVGGIAQCDDRGGIESVTDRGACVCIPP